MIGTTQRFNSFDPRTKVAQADDERQRKAGLKKRQEELLKSNADVVKAVQDMKAGEEEGSVNVMTYVSIAFFIVFAVGVTSVYGIMWILDNIDF